MLVRFTRRTVYETEGRGLGPVFEAGLIVDLSEDMALRWIRRGVAVEHDGAVDLAPFDDGGQPPTVKKPPARLKLPRRGSS